MSSWLPLFAAWTVLLTRGAAALVVDLPILHKSERLLAIAKPPGVSHHDDPSAGELGMLSLIREKQGGPNSSFPYPGRLHGVHRLDRVTLGILLLAKDLAAKFRQGEVTKYYAALSGKEPRKKKQGWVRGEMVPGRRGSYKLHTGKMHQLRVAAKSLGLPILGDARYGGGSLPRIAAADVDAEGGVAPGDWDRTYLHAAALHVRLDDGEEVAIWSTPPFDHLFAGTDLGDVYVEMMEKHCECTKIDV
ncbi:hypothetical protein ACHAWF_009172 [Thalassiosira exigua]